MSKNTLTIGQLSEITGLSAHTLRYYERIGLLNDVERSESGRRYYTLGHLGWLDFVMRMRSTGMAIPEIIRYAELACEGDSTTEARLHLLEEHQVALEEQIENLQRDLHVLKDKIAYYKSLNMPEDYQPEQHHRWHLQLNPDDPTKSVEKLPTVILDYLYAKSLQAGLAYVRELDHGWNWTSKYHFLESIQLIYQIMPDLHWNISDVRTQAGIYEFDAQPKGQFSERKQIAFRGQRYIRPMLDEIDDPPITHMLVHVLDGFVVNFKMDIDLDVWLGEFLKVPAHQVEVM